MPDDECPQSNLELLLDKLAEGSLARRLIETALPENVEATPDRVLIDRMNEIRDELQNPNT